MKNVFNVGVYVCGGGVGEVSASLTRMVVREDGAIVGLTPNGCVLIISGDSVTLIRPAKGHYFKVNEHVGEGSCFEQFPDPLSDEEFVEVEEE